MQIHRMLYVFSYMHAYVCGSDVYNITTFFEIFNDILQRIKQFVTIKVHLSLVPENYQIAYTDIKPIIKKHMQN